MMPRFLLVTLLGLLLCACSRQESVSFIPASPLTPEEVEQARQALRNSPEFADLDAAEVVRSNDSMFTYRVEDIQKALQGIGADDELVSICSSSVLDGAARLVLLAPEQPDSVVVKSAPCSPVQGGLSCGSVVAEQMSYYTLPSTFFALKDGVTSEEARRVMSAFESGGIANMPESLALYDYNTVMAIGKSAQIYTLSLGDRACNSCSAQVSVVMATDNRLTLVGEPAMTCK